MHDCRRMEKRSLRTLPEDYSHLYMAIGGQLAAVICIEDPLREEAAVCHPPVKRGWI